MSNNMQNQWDDEDDDFDFDDDQQEQPATRGNDLVKQLRKADRAKEKRLREMEAELQSLRAERRNISVAQVLKSEGVSEKIAKFIPAEINDEVAVKAWLDENSEIFNIQRNAPTNTQVPNEDAYRSMEAATSGAISPTQLDDIYAQIDRAESPEEVAAIYARLGEIG